MEHCWRNVEARLPFLKAARAPVASLRGMTTASERSSSRAAASKARTPAEGVVLEDPADEHGRLGNGAGKGDGVVGVEFALGAEDGREKGHERADVREARGVVLDPAAEGGKVMDRAFASAEKFLKTLGQAEFLVLRDGDGAPVGVNNLASVSDSLGWKLSLLVAEA